MRVDVRPALLRWARERAELDADMLIPRFPSSMLGRAERPVPRCDNSKVLQQQLTPRSVTSSSRPRRLNESRSPISVRPHTGGADARARTCSTLFTSASSARTGTATLRGLRAERPLPFVGSARAD